VSVHPIRVVMNATTVELKVNDCKKRGLERIGEGNMKKERQRN